MRRYRLFMRVMTLSALLVLSSHCVTSSVLLPKLDEFGPVEKGRPIRDFQARSDFGMVVAAHPAAAQAGAEMLNRGGNAIDAAVAASFTISVVRPQSTGLGGGGFLLWHDHAEKKTHVYDFRERAPEAASRDMYLDAKGQFKKAQFGGKEVTNLPVNGHLAVAVPGLVKGLVEMQRAHGRLKLAEVMAPAIRAATLGFEVYPTLAEALEDRKDVLAIYDSSRKIFFKNGKPLRLGDLLIQRDLAATLTSISEQGEDAFYKGSIGDKIVAEIKRGKGILTKNDLLAYSMRERLPVVSTYHGYTVQSMPPPSSGGVHVIEMLNMLEADDLPKMGQGSSAYLHLLSESMRRAFADRSTYMGDPEFVKVPVVGLTSKAYAKQLRAAIALDHATASNELRNPKLDLKESSSTSHISVVDHWGNAVSTTQTVNYKFGSCVVAEGTGIVLNDEMDDFSTKPGSANAFGLVQGDANAIASHKTPLSSMSPTILLDKNGDVKMVVGSPGGPMIISAVLQTIVNYIDFKMPLTDAVHTYRIHHQWLPDQIKYERGGISESTLKELAKIGHGVAAVTSIGDVQAIAREADGSLEGVSDTRAEGKPVGATRSR